MIDYCKSDVALLKAGCEAFQQEFQTQAGFNPMAKCMTIASACNLYWLKHHLPPKPSLSNRSVDGGGPMLTDRVTIPRVSFGRVTCLNEFK